MSKKEQIHLFLQNFVGTEIEIMLNLYHEIQQTNETEILIQKNPLAMKGFVLDMDDEFVYLGETPHAITRFCRKSLIAGGEISKEDSSSSFNNDDFPTSGSMN